MHNAKKSYFQNPAIYAILVYYLGSLINDAAVFWYGWHGVFTPRQIAIVIGIAIVTRRLRCSPSPLYQYSILCLLLYYLVCVGSYAATVAVGHTYPGLALRLATVGANILWLSAVGCFLSEGFTDEDKRRLVRWMLILGAIPLATGVYEIARGEQILSGDGLAQMHLVGSLFFVRGFHFDKVDYVTALAPPLFISFLLIPRTRLRVKLVLIAYFGASMLCVFYSYSATGIVGVAGGLVAIIIIFGNLRTKVATVCVIAVGLSVLSMATDTEQGEKLIKWYDSKLERGLDLDRNVRYAMNVIAVREFVRNPAWGVGFGGHVPIVHEELSGWGGGGNTHSVMSIPADLGILGALPFGLFWFILYARVLKPLPKIARVQRSSIDPVLQGLCLGLSVFVLARLLLYFHAMSNEAFFIWPALMYAVYSRRWKSSAAGNSPCNVEVRGC